MLFSYAILHPLLCNAYVAGRLRLNYADDHPEEGHRDLELPHFDLSTIVKATDNFAINNKLGQGGFGPVYKVKLSCNKTFYFKYSTSDLCLPCESPIIQYPERKNLKRKKSLFSRKLNKACIIELHT